MSKQPRHRASIYADPSASSVGYLHLVSGAGRPDHGSMRRAHAAAADAVADADAQHPVVSATWHHLSEFYAEHTPDELAPAFEPHTHTGMSIGAVTADVGLGGWLGWQLANGDNPLLKGVGYAGPVLSAFSLAAVFGLSSLALAEGAGRALSRLLARSHATALKPHHDDLVDERVERGSVSKRRLAFDLVMAGLGALGIAGFLYANTLRESAFNTASVHVDAMAVAVLGTMLPFGLMLVKAYWYSREAAVEHLRLTRRFGKELAAWRRSYRRASRRVADAEARKASLIAAALLADGNQPTSATAERVVALIDQRMPTLRPLDADFPVQVP